MNSGVFNSLIIPSTHTTSEVSRWRCIWHVFWNWNPVFRPFPRNSR